MNILSGPISDLREKRLWPIAVALLAALIAVPLLLMKPSPAPSTPVAAQPSSAGAASVPPVSGLPAVSLSTGTSHARLTGPGRDPFRQRGFPVTSPIAAPGSGTGAGAGGKTGSTGSVSSGSGSTTGPGASTTSGTGTSTTGTSTGTSTSPEVTPAPQPETTPNTLAATDTYRVKLALTNPSGNLNTLDGVQRLSVLPSKQQPALIELGVLRGGHRVLFALTPGTSVSGKGTCTPGPIDCEVLSLAPNQIENLSVNGGSGDTSLGSFAVTGIKVDHHPSAAAATKARQRVSADGRALLKSLTSPVLDLFQYKPGLGTLIDLRNLHVGGL